MIRMIRTGFVVGGGTGSESGVSSSWDGGQAEGAANAQETIAGSRPTSTRGAAAVVRSVDRHGSALRARVLISAYLDILTRDIITTDEGQTVGVASHSVTAVAVDFSPGWKNKG